MRIAALHMDPKDKLGFEIHGKSSVKYHLKANHQVEAKRWFWSLNNAIQWSKDEAREEKRREKQGNEALRQARAEHLEKSQTHETASGALGLSPTIGNPAAAGSSYGGSTLGDGDASAYNPSAAGDEITRVVSRANTATMEGDNDDDDDEYGDDASSHDAQPTNKDAFNITAQSAKLQLDLLSQVSAALQSEKDVNPHTPISDPRVVNALTSYDTAVQNLKGLMLDLLRISRDHDAYWQHRLDREANVRRLWEDSMARVAKEQEELEGRIGESEDKRRKTKRALREALEGQGTVSGARSRRPTESAARIEEAVAGISLNDDQTAVPEQGLHRRRTVADLTNNEISDDDSDMEDEFYDAVDAGEVEVVDEMPAVSPPHVAAAEDDSSTHGKITKAKEIEKSYKGYEDGIRKRLNLDADNRPKASLWVSLVSSSIHNLANETRLSSSQ